MFTDEQLEKAAGVYYTTFWATNSGDTDVKRMAALRAAAPFLQLPQADPTEEETERFNLTYYADPGNCKESTRVALKEFITARNAALIPKPVDPRVAEVLFAIETAPLDETNEQLAARLLKLLDGDQ